MSVAVPAESYADPVLLRSTLERGGEVAVCETHCSIVFLVGDRAYKLRRPVLFDFVDQRSTTARASICLREVELNATLAPGLVLGVRAVVPSEDGSGYTFGRVEDPLAIDYVVEMRRFDEDDTMASLTERGSLTLEQASAAGARLAPFHRDSKAQSSGIDYRAVIDRNFEAMLPLTEGVMSAVERLMLQRFAAAFLLEWDDVLEARATAGSVVDGHGDLRAEHVLLESGNVLVIDRLEFDALRVVDVADDLGFLLMDLHDLNAAQGTSDAVLAGYRDAGGTPQPEALLAFFGAYRAQVRAKVALLRSAQPGVDAPVLRERARVLLTLSGHLSWRARGPITLLVTGPPAAGKSTLASALARVSGLPVLSSDAIRKERAGNGSPDYSTDGRAAIYAELGRRAGLERAVIVDASFGNPTLERAFHKQLAADGAGEPLVVECRAPSDVRVARARQRQLHEESDSDAGPEVARKLGDGFVATRGAATDGHLAVDTAASMAMQVDEVASWLDSLLAAGRSA